MGNFVNFFIGLLMMTTTNVLLQVDKALLIKCIKQVEIHGPLMCMDDLYKAVTDAYNRCRGPLWQLATYSEIADRMKRWDLGCKTQDKGSSPSKPPSLSKELVLVKNTPTDPEIQRRCTKILSIPIKYQEIYRAAYSGSIEDAVGAKCLDCCGDSAVEVANCSVTDCPLHQYRPFKSTKTLNVEENIKIRTSSKATTQKIIHHVHWDEDTNCWVTQDGEVVLVGEGPHKPPKKEEAKKEEKKQEKKEEKTKEQVEPKMATINTLWAKTETPLVPQVLGEKELPQHTMVDLS